MSDLYVTSLSSKEVVQLEELPERKMPINYIDLKRAVICCVYYIREIILCRCE